MGIYYDQHRMIGADIWGGSDSVLAFLEKNGYTFTPEQMEELEDSGQWDYDVAEMTGIPNLIIVAKNGVVFEDFFIGFDLEINKENSKKAKLLEKEFQKYFPASSSVFSSFTSMM